MLSEPSRQTQPWVFHFRTCTCCFDHMPIRVRLQHKKIASKVLRTSHRHLHSCHFFLRKPEKIFRMSKLSKRT